STDPDEVHGFLPSLRRDTVLLGAPRTHAENSDATSALSHRSTGLVSRKIPHGAKPEQRARNGTVGSPRGLEAMLPGGEVHGPDPESKALGRGRPVGTRSRRSEDGIDARCARAASGGVQLEDRLQLEEGGDAPVEMAGKVVPDQLFAVARAV